jgi:hypothetical protein
MLLLSITWNNAHHVRVRVVTYTIGLVYQYCHEGPTPPSGRRGLFFAAEPLRSLFSFKLQENDLPMNKKQERPKTREEFLREADLFA